MSEHEITAGFCCRIISIFVCKQLSFARAPTQITDFVRLIMM